MVLMLVISLLRQESSGISGAISYISCLKKIIYSLDIFLIRLNTLLCYLISSGMTTLEKAKIVFSPDGTVSKQPSSGRGNPYDPLSSRIDRVVQVAPRPAHATYSFTHYSCVAGAGGVVCWLPGSSFLRRTCSS